MAKPLTSISTRASNLDLRLGLLTSRKGEVSPLHYLIGLADDIDMEQASKIANKIAIAGEEAYPE